MAGLCTYTCPRPWDTIILMLGDKKKALVNSASWLFIVISFYCPSPRLGKLLERKGSEIVGFDHWQSSNLHIYGMCFNVFWVKKEYYSYFHGGAISLISNFSHRMTPSGNEWIISQLLDKQIFRTLAMQTFFEFLLWIFIEKSRKTLGYFKLDPEVNITSTGDYICL